MKAAVEIHAFQYHVKLNSFFFPVPRKMSESLQDHPASSHLDAWHIPTEGSSAVNGAAEVISHGRVGIVFGALIRLLIGAFTGIVGLGLLFGNTEDVAELSWFLRALGIPLLLVPAYMLLALYRWIRERWRVGLLRLRVTPTTAHAGEIIHIRLQALNSSRELGGCTVEFNLQAYELPSDEDKWPILLSGERAILVWRPGSREMTIDARIPMNAGPTRDGYRCVLLATMEDNYRATMGREIKIRKMRPPTS
ncbi:MAG: hypothetical protein ABL931_04760 [Usitatibacteraceae bacterium]